MRLIADSGSTKTDWLITDGGTANRHVFTQGINPFHQSREAMERIIGDELMPLLTENIESVCFYGSGVRAEMEEMMCSVLRQFFPDAVAIVAHNDLLGAAHALCGAGEGIACILGTGANSCLYDGEKIVKNTPALGYILGDEGSGAVLGRMFLNALYKGRLPQTLQDEFLSDTGLTMVEVIERVYRQPMANRFLASLSPFIHAHLDIPEVKAIVIDNFRRFFRNNIAPYGRPDLKVGAVGSIAFHYESELREAAAMEGFVMGEIRKSPL